MKNDNNKLVVSYYVNAAAAEAAADDLKKWDDANDAVKLGAIAILTIDPKSGKLEANEVGQRKTKGGTLWGTAIGATVGILSGGIGLIPGLLLGAGGGAAIGSMFHKDIGMTDAEHDVMVERLRHGGAGLAVMADDFEVEATAAKMAEIGGIVEQYNLPDDVAAAVTTAAAVQTEAVAAVDEAEAEVVVESADLDDEVVESVRSATVDLVPETATAVTGLALASRLGADDALKLHEAGVTKASELLKQGATPAGREALAAESGLSTDTILVAVKKMDLMRIKGVGALYANLLLASGIDTVPELARRNAENLYAAMDKTNAADAIVKEMPGQGDVAGWINQAKELPRVIVF